jgi:D-alanyl-lipoteichoic acid acyltransferase DltB (MBOAT superfamily)
VATIVSGAPRAAIAEPQGRIGALPLMAILVQLGLLALVLRQFQIESGAFLRLVLLAFAGFAVHALLPLRLRLPFFLLLSLAGIVLVLGFENALWLVGLGLVLIGICYLPIAFSRRVAILASVAVLLAVQRADWLPAPWSNAIWPILGSMFMFRMIVYLYDLRFEKTPPDFVRTAAYFFMLPNACFPLFPVVDYKAFRRNYFDADAYQIYQTGVDWILRGIVHLILYRFVYYYLTLAPSEVRGPGDFAQFMISNFLLYLRVSGLFHLVVGMLYLYGFRLPETHHHYLLASSFTDFWRRINIYWKDFMLKVFYYPLYFRLRKKGPIPALVISTMFVLVMTWVLHVYQWFWLRGTAFWVWRDMLFWAMFGALVALNAVREERRGRQAGLGRQVKSRGALFRLTLQTFAMFCTICIMWSFWTADSLGEWLSLWEALGGKVTFEAGHAIIPIVAVIIIAGTLRENVGQASTLGVARAGKGAPVATFPAKAALMTTAGLVVLLSFGIERLYTRFGAEVATTIQSLRSGQLSRLDNAKLERGYYENLLQVDRFNSRLWEVYMNKPANWLDIESGALKRFTDDFAQVELKPSFIHATNYGTISINRWGMRDQDYALAPAAGTFRMAVLGPSTVMGWGVGDGATFEALVEKRLNEELRDTPYSKFEILNFGVPGYQPPQELVMTEKALRFAPRAVLYTAGGREASRAASYLVEVVNKRIDVPYAPLRDVIAKAGLAPGMEEATALKRLEPYRLEILDFTYRHIVEQCRRHGAVPVWVFVPQIREGRWQEENPQIFRAAEAAGFVMIDLSDVFKDQDIDAVRLAEWDEHPSARGHELIAARLYAELIKRKAIVFSSGNP